MPATRAPKLLSKARFFAEFFFEDFGPRPEYHRYDATLTYPKSGRPIAGMIYDRETTEIFYLVTKMIY